MPREGRATRTAINNTRSETCLIGLSLANEGTQDPHTSPPYQPNDVSAMVNIIDISFILLDIHLRYGHQASFNIRNRASRSHVSRNLTSAGLLAVHRHPAYPGTRARP